MIEHALDLVVILDAHGDVVYASPSHERVLGYRTSELTGQSAFDLVHEEDRVRLRDAFARIVATPGATANVEFRFRHKDGSLRTLEAIGVHPADDPAVGGFVVHSRDVSERRAAEDRTAALLEVARDLATTLDPAEILDRVQRRMVTMLPCDSVATFQWDEVDQVFRMVSEYGSAPEARRALAELSFKSAEPFEGRLYEGPVVLNDARSAPGMAGMLATRFGVESLVAAPLRVPGRYFGSLTAYRRTPGRPFDDRHVELCCAIAAQVAVALERVELYRIEREAAEVSSALARAGRELLATADLPGLSERLSSLVAELLGCEKTHTLLWLPAEQTFAVVAAHGIARDDLDALQLVRLSPEEVIDVLALLGASTVAPLGGTERAETSELPPLLRATRTGPSLLVALRKGAHVVGVLLASRKAMEAPFTRADLRIAEGIAQLVSMALEHARIRAELDAANRLKSEFVAMMSHELRTPLNAILGYGDLLQDGAFGTLSSDQTEVLGRVQRSSRELLRLIDEVLDLSRLETGRIPIRTDRISVAELLADLELETRHLPVSDDIALRFAADPALPPLLTDGAKLKVILRNLVINALKFTERGSVEIGASAAEGGVAVHVSDTGIGIPPEHLETVFEPFRQAHEAPRRGHGGVGLGLYIVRRIAGLLGGTVSLHSEVGVGSTFRVWIPSGPAMGMRDDLPSPSTR